MSPPRDDRVEKLVRARSLFDDGYEVSWAASSQNLAYRLHDDQRRKACENHVLWHYRVHTKLSTIANHARATDAGRRQVQNSGKLANAFGFEPPPSRPLRLYGHPLSVDWMNLRWSPFFWRNELKQGRRWDSEIYDPRVRRHGPALYRMLGPSRKEILKIGYAEDAMRGTRRVLDDLPEGTKVSWYSLSPSVHKYECCELKSDLIGAYYHQIGRAPRFQFTGSRGRPVHKTSADNESSLTTDG
jgi:hypothetical protein